MPEENGVFYQLYDYKGDGLAVFQALRAERHAFFLNSRLHAGESGRYSFIGYDPFDVFRGETPEALDQMKAQFQRWARDEHPEFSPLPCGMVGYLSYDFGLVHENIPLTGRDDFHLPYLLFGCYDTMITVDHQLKKVFLSSSGLPEKESSARRERARQRLAAMEKRLADVIREDRCDTVVEQPVSSPSLKLSGTFTRESYCRAVEEILQLIDDGEIYQANLSQRFDLQLPAKYDPLDLYARLIVKSPTAFMAYFDGGDHQILSSSPERFLHKRDRTVHTRPMKGTRPRGRDQREDEKLLKEMEMSVKDQAELLMITDLERNDLGRVCETGSVHVRDLRSIETYSTVYQATSTVAGTLAADKDGFDLLAACFPSGSITGCPKLRAMQIIDQLEPTRRGIYTGALGYMSFGGNMDFNILIRTILIKDQRLYYQVGGGVVSDSLPALEYEETLVKAAAIQRCIADAFSTKK